MKVAVYPGSFDPVTNGHLDVVERARGLFDQLIVAVLKNPNKQPLFTVDERITLLKEAVSGWDNVLIDSFEGLLAEYTRLRSAAAIVRGLREIGDFENELRMAQMNRTLDPNAVSIFIPTNHEYSYVSSSLVKEVARYHGDVSSFVPAHVELAMSKKYQNLEGTL